MPLPTSYSEPTLAAFMVTELGPIAPTLGWTSSTTRVLEAVYDVAGLLGAAIADVEDVPKLRTLARWRIWMAAESATVDQYDLSAGNTRLSRSQLYDHIAKQLQRAEAAAQVYPEAQQSGAGGVVSVTSLFSTEDPYSAAYGGSW